MRVRALSAGLALGAWLACVTPNDVSASNRPVAHDAVARTHGGAPSWRAVDLDGRTWSSEALRGRVVLVDFWATWCAPCLADLPRLKRLHARHAADGFTIIGVSLDRSSVRDFRSWLQRQAIAWPQVREAGGYDSPLARLFGVESIPASFLFDRRGRLHATHLTGEALDARVRMLLEAR